MIVAATILALGEAAVLAERSGIDVAQLFDLLSGGYAASRILETRAPRIVEQNYAPSGPAKYMVKKIFASRPTSPRPPTPGPPFRQLLRPPSKISPHKDSATATSPLPASTSKTGHAA